MTDNFLLAPPDIQAISPATISTETTLGELRRLKQGWIQAARDLDYPQSIWQVVSWLGSKVRTCSLRECQVWQSSDVAIIANEYPLRFSPELNTNICQRSFGVWLADGKNHPSRSNQVDEIIFGSNLVARWVWLVAADKLEEVEPELLFLPGRWLNPILAELGHAHQAARQSHLDNLEAERQKLLAEMLIGLDI